MLYDTGHDYKKNIRYPEHFLQMGLAHQELLLIFTMLRN
jgi:hypothetical protein